MKTLKLFFLLGILTVTSVNAQDYQDLIRVKVNGKIDYGNVNPAFADIDNDGDIDMAVGIGNGKTYMFINDGAGNLVYDDSIILQSIGTFESYPAFADFDNDGDADAFIANYHLSISFQTNDGSGNFTPGSSSSDNIDQSTQVGRISFADLDNDGDLDLYGGTYNGDIQVFINDGTGNFANPVYLQSGGVNIDIGDHAAPAFADLDNDGDVDLYIGNSLGVVKVFLNDGNGNLTAGADLQADGAPINIGSRIMPAFADLDQDNDLDLYLGGVASIKVFINDGNGNFTSAPDLTVKKMIYDAGDNAMPVFADLNNDGVNELYVSNKTGTIDILEDNGDESYNKMGKIQADGADLQYGTYLKFDFADLDNDNDLDIYVGNYGNHVMEYLNDGNNNFHLTGALQSGGADIDISGRLEPKFADLDNDGDLDLYLGNNRRITVFINNNGDFTNMGYLQSGGSNIQKMDLTLAFGDNDNDGDLDLYIGERLNGITLFENDGTGNFINTGYLQANGVDMLEGTGIYRIPGLNNNDADCYPDLFIGDGNGYLYKYAHIDSTNPTLTCITNQNVNADASHVYTVIGTEFDITSSDDNCTVANITNDFNNNSSLAGASFPPGTTTVTWTVTDQTGNTAQCSFDVAVTDTSDIQNYLNNTISIYPNPTENIIRISLKNDITIHNISIMNMEGKVLWQQENIENISLQNFDNAMYFIKIETDKDILVKKIIKK